MALASARSQQIYARVLAASAPLLVVGAFAFLDVDLDSGRMTEFTGSLLASLSDDFLEEELIQSGVACRDADGNLQPSCALRPGVPIVALRKKPDDVPYDLLTPSGALSGQLPVVASIYDFRVRAWLQESTDLLVADCVEAVAILRRLGIGATLATGLQSLTLPQFDEVAKFYDWRRWGLASVRSAQASDEPDETLVDGSNVDESDSPAAANETDPALADAFEPSVPPCQDADALDSEAAFDDKPRLCFVDFDLVALSPLRRTAFEAIEARFRWLKNAYLEFDATGRWQPSTRFLSALSIFAEAGESETIHRAIKRDLETAPKFLGDLPEESRPAVERLIALLKQESRSRQLSIKDRLLLVDEIMAAAGEVLFDPMVTMLTSARGATEKVGGLHFVKMSMEALHKLLLLKTDLRPNSSLEEIKRAEALEKLVLRYTDRLIALGRNFRF